MFYFAIFKCYIENSIEYWKAENILQDTRYKIQDTQLYLNSVW